MYRSLFIFACLSLAAFAHKSKQCSTVKKSFMANAKDYAESYETYREECEYTGLGSIEKCMEMGYHCWFYGDHYYSGAYKYMINFPQLSHCVNVVEASIQANDTSSSFCYCDRYVYYFSEILEMGEVPSNDKSCSSKYQNDCYEYVAWEACTEAEAYCKLGWDAQCLSTRDEVWLLYYGTCQVLAKYLDYCDHSDPTDYCDTLTGNETYNYDECLDYTIALTYCPDILRLADNDDFDDLLNRIKLEIQSSATIKLDKIYDCFDKINSTKCDSDDFSAELLSTTQSSLFSMSFIPLFVTLIAGLIVGLTVGVRFTKNSTYQSIPFSLSTEVN